MKRLKTIGKLKLILPILLLSSCIKVNDTRSPHRLKKLGPELGLNHLETSAYSWWYNTVFSDGAGEKYMLYAIISPKQTCILDISSVFECATGDYCTENITRKLFNWEDVNISARSGGVQFENEFIDWTISEKGSSLSIDLDEFNIKLEGGQLNGVWMNGGEAVKFFEDAPDFYGYYAFHKLTGFMKNSEKYSPISGWGTYEHLYADTYHWRGMKWDWFTVFVDEDLYGGFVSAGDYSEGLLYHNGIPVEFFDFKVDYLSLDEESRRYPVHSLVYSDSGSLRFEGKRLGRAATELSLSIVGTFIDPSRGTVEFEGEGWQSTNGDFNYAK